MIISDIPFQASKVNILKDDSIRIKVTNRCPFHCNFCHHEGSKNSQDLSVGQELLHGLTQFHKIMNLSQAHLTGGEPTSYPLCVQLIQEIKRIGYNVKLTSNGQFNSSILKKLKRAGLEGINFSIHTLDAEKLANIQRPKKAFDWGKKALAGC